RFRDPRGALDAAIRLRARLARSGAVVRRHLAAVFPDPPVGCDPRRQLLLSHPAGDGADGLAPVRRAFGAVGASRHGGLRRRRVPGQLTDRWCQGVSPATVPLQRNPLRGVIAMSVPGPIEYRDASAAVRAVFHDIKRTRQVEDVNNFWKYLAHDPAT